MLLSIYFSLGPVYFSLRPVYFRLGLLYFSLGLVYFKSGLVYFQARAETKTVRPGTLTPHPDPTPLPTPPHPRLPGIDTCMHETTKPLHCPWWLQECSESLMGEHALNYLHVLHTHEQQLRLWMVHCGALLIHSSA